MIYTTFNKIYIILYHLCDCIIRFILLKLRILLCKLSISQNKLFKEIHTLYEAIYFYIKVIESSIMK